MKPLRITMKAFGPFHEKNELDLRPYYREGLFLLRGETGSGKTSILDALTIALYGKSSGGKKGELADLRCQQAAPEEETSVCCELEVNGSIYRFERSLVPFVKRNGEYDLRAEQNIAKLDAASGLFEPLHANLKKTLALREAERIIGLTYDQFCQVVILPQGQFERFLTASSEDKELILSSIFAADRYETAATLLKERANAERAELETVRQALNMLLQQEEAADVAALRSAVEEKNEVLAALKKRMEELRLQQQSTADALKKGQFLASEFRTLDVLLEQSEAVARRRADLSLLEAAIARAEQAERLQPFRRAAEKAAAEFQRSREELGRLKAESEKAEAAARQAGEEAASELPVLKREILQMSLEEVALERQLQEYQDWSAALQRLEKLAGQRQETEGQLNRLRERQKALLATKEACALILKGQNELQEARIHAKLSQDRLQQAVAAEQTCLQTMDKLDPVFKRQAGLQADLRAAAGHLQKLSEEEAKLRAEEKTYWTMILQNDLVPDEPCPVCGVPHRPADQVSAPHLLVRPQENQLRVLEEEHRLATEQLAELQRQADQSDQDIRTHYLQLQTAVGQLADRLQVCPPDSAEGLFSPEHYERLRASMVTLRTECKRQAKAFAEQEGRLRRRLLEQQQAEREQTAAEQGAAEIAAQIEGLSERQTQLSLEEAKWQGESARLQGSAAAFAKVDGLPETVLQAHRVNLKQRRTREAELEAAKQETEATWRAAATAYAVAQSTATAARTSHEQATAEWAEVLQAGPFETAAAVEAALLAPDLLSEKKQTAADWQRQLIAHESERQRLQTALKDQVRPDLNALSRACEAAEAALNEVRETYYRSEQRLQSSQRALAAATRLEKKAGDRIETVERLTEFAVLLKGEQGVGLRRYVIGIMLNNVISEANALLRHVHDGRYQLLRQREAAGRERKVGLNFAVVDGCSGRERSVSTLSGGEKFLVALALSLGLSAVVQLQTGGVRIAAMFIDEGFGSLDSASIGDAMEMLIRERQEGRLIGIISHVRELKDTIPLAVDVVKTPTGSRLRTEF